MGPVGLKRLARGSLLLRGQVPAVSRPLLFPEGTGDTHAGLEPSRDTLVTLVVPDSLPARPEPGWFLRAVGAG